MWKFCNVPKFFNSHISNAATDRNYGVKKIIKFRLVTMIMPNCEKNRIFLIPFSVPTQLEMNYLPFFHEIIVTAWLIYSQLLSSIILRQFDSFYS